MPNASRGRAPAAPERKRHFGISDVVPPELRPDVICRAEAAQGPRVIEYSDHVRLSFAGIGHGGCVARVLTVVQLFVSLD